MGENSGFCVLKDLYKDYEWIYGDLHMHTAHSDGRLPYQEAIKYCIQAGYEYVATTDHNTTSQNYEEYKEEYGDLIIIPGIEDSTYEFDVNAYFIAKGNPNFSGHFNILGLKESPIYVWNYNSKDHPENYNPLVDGNKIFKQVSNTVRDLGGKITINHPYSEKFSWKMTKDKKYYDFLEVWNGKSCQQQSLNYWQGELEKGYIIPVVGGSDSHKQGVTMTPYNVTFVKERTVNGVLDALSAGHNYIIQSRDTSPIVELYYGEYIMGDKVKYNPNKKLRLRISNIKDKIRISLYNQTGLVYKSEGNEGACEHIYEYSVSSKDIFYRVEIFLESENSIGVVTNPIYFSQ